MKLPFIVNRVINVFCRDFDVPPAPPFTILNPNGTFPVVLTCEHASYALPPAYGTLGIPADELQRHIGWDIGARAVVQEMLQHIYSTAILSQYSRLLIDCNRAVSDDDLIIPESDGTRVPANRHLTEAERQRRLTQFYHPYHAAIDQVLTQKMPHRVFLLSVHSFTPVLGEKKRTFDLGILFDRYEDLAQEFGQRLRHAGYRVRYNEPYSGYEGLIFSARSHGERQQLVYLEIEINNGVLLDRVGRAVMGQKLSQVLRDLFSPPLKTPNRR